MNTPAAYEWRSGHLFILTAPMHPVHTKLNMEIELHICPSIDPSGLVAIHASGHDHLDLWLEPATAAVLADALKSVAAYTIPEVL